MQMKAIVNTSYGSPEVLKLKEVEIPVPKENEVLIKVFATTVNRTDCAMLRAQPFIMRFFNGLLKPNRPIPGTDFAGKIAAVGKGVDSFQVGDKVFGFDDLGVGSKAEYMIFSKDKAIATIPDGISYEQAAASIEGAHYAFNFINKTVLKSGQKVLVNGATGAIGSAAIQLSKYYGADVTAVCGTEHIDLVKTVGANKIIDYLKEDFTKSSEKYHYIFDAVGKSSFQKCRPLLEPGGVYISSELGFMVQNPLLALVTPFFGKKKVVFPIPFNIKKSVQLIKNLMEEGKFRAVIDKTYKLEEIAKAYRYVETGQKIGNVVIKL